MRRTFALTTELLDRHRGNAVMALDPRAIGRGYSFFAEPSPVSPERQQVDGADVAIVAVMGPLEQRASEWMCGYSDGYDAIEARFSAAMSNPDVGAVVLLIDSPGGDAAGNSETVRRMTEMKRKIRKPVYAYADELAASAAYALATVADEIYLPASGEVGSIGTLMVHAENSRQLENAGIEVTVIRSGAKKAEANSLEPLTDSARERLQGAVDTLANQFAGLVAVSRDMSVESVLALEGAVFMGQKAIDAGLADGIASIGDVMTKAASAAQERRNEMNAAEALGLPATASAEEIRAKAEGLREHAKLGAALAPMVGEDPEKAKAMVNALLEIQKLAAADAASREKTERADLVARLVVAGWEIPATAWKNAESREPAEPYASMPMAALRARVETFEKQPRSFNAPKAVEGGGLTKDELAACEQMGCDPKVFVAMKAQRNAARAAVTE